MDNGDGNEYVFVLRVDESKESNEKYRYEMKSSLVRCKDCKYAKKWNVNTIRCMANSNDPNAFHRDDWFCADGKRKAGL